MSYNSKKSQHSPLLLLHPCPLGTLPLLILSFLCPICKSGAVASPALSTLNLFLAGKRKKEICVGKKVGGGDFMVISGLEAEGQGSQVKLKKSAVSQRMGHKGRGQRGRAVCIQIKGSPKTFFFSLGPLFHHIQRAFISFPALFTTLASPHWLLIPQPQTFSVAAQNVYCTYKAKKF